MQVIQNITVFDMDTTHSTPPVAAAAAAQHWTVDQVTALFDLPFNDLIYRAQTVHREHFDPNAVQRSTLLSIKTGGCPEDCGYCPQAARYHTGVENEAMLSVDQVLAVFRRHGFAAACEIGSIAAQSGQSSLVIE